MADLQLQQHDPVLGPVLAAWPATPPTPWNALRGRFLLKNGILRRGQADQRRGTLEQLILPSSFRPDVQERSGTTSAAARGALWCHALGKKEGNMMLGMVVR